MPPTLCRATEALLQAKAIEQHDSTLLHLGRVYALQADYTAAIAVYLEALQLDTRNAETLTTIGLLYLRIGQNQKAFDFLGNALSHDPKSVKAILAAASVIQAGGPTHLPVVMLLRFKAGLVVHRLLCVHAGSPGCRCCSGQISCCCCTDTNISPAVEQHRHGCCKFELLMECTVVLSLT